ncbi:hypothetical protein ACFLUF_02555 [Chloroflexota bacterium]
MNIKMPPAYAPTHPPPHMHPMQNMSYGGETPSTDNGSIVQQALSILQQKPGYQKVMDHIALETGLDPEKLISQDYLFENPSNFGLKTPSEMREATDYLRSVQAIKGTNPIQISTNAKNLASKEALLTLENRV